MNNEVIILSVILAGAVILFLTDRIRMDVVALIVLVLLAVTGIITSQEAISGFSNSAVITIWSMFILSAALIKTNAAKYLGKSVLKLGSQSETRVTTSVMVISGLLSVFMNNIGVAALMLPVTMDLCRRTNIPPSKLLMPMAFGTLLGGFTTLLTTTNILASEFLRNNNLTPFGLSDFFPVGIFIFISGVAFISVWGRRLLPVKHPAGKAIEKRINISEHYALQERTCIMKIKKGSFIAGKTIAETHLGEKTGITVYAVIRIGQTQLVTSPDLIIRDGDQLLVGGRLDRLNEFRGWLNLKIDNTKFIPDNFISGEIKLATVKINEDSSLSNQTVYETNFRNKYGLNILAIKRGANVFRVHLSGFKLMENDELLVQGKEDKLSQLAGSNDFCDYRLAVEDELKKVFKVHDRVFTVKVPESSMLIDQSLSKSRMGTIFDLSVVAIIRNGETIVMPSPEELIKKSDMLVIEGSTEDLDILHGLQEIEIEQEQSPDLSKFESEQVGLIEATLSPRSALTGKTLRQIHFRMKYGLQILDIWREGRAIGSNLRDIELKFGDALLILGPHKNLRMLSKDPDFIVLSGEIKEEMNTKKAPLAALIMAGILSTALIGLLPIAIAALLGVVLMIITKCITIDDAYRAIDWKAVFLIAGMLPVGIALQKTGAASIISDYISGFTGIFGIWGVLTGLYILITLASTILPSSALVVLMAPVVYNIALEVHGSPYTFMMLLAIAASASFLSPVSHPSNVLVMGPGGYRFIDYVKVGIPLTIVVMIVGLIMLSVFWPVR